MRQFIRHIVCGLREGFPLCCIIQYAVEAGLLGGKPNLRYCRFMGVESGVWIEGRFSSGRVWVPCEVHRRVVKCRILSREEVDTLLMKWFIEMNGGE